MLCRIRIIVNLLGNHLPKPRLLGKPFASEATHRMPANLDWPGLAVYSGVGFRDHIWHVSKASSMLQCDFTLDQVLLATGNMSAAANSG